MHLRILGVVKTFFDAFAHTSRPPKTFEQKRYFLLTGVVKNVFWSICAYSQTTRNCFFKKDIFYWLEWLKRVLMHLCILPDHQKLFFKKYILYRLEWLKTCFVPFSHTSRPPETFFQKRYFLPSGVVKDVFWCICAYSQTTRNFFSK